MAVVLKMRCPNCGTKFRVTLYDAEAETPECPVCSVPNDMPDKLDLTVPKAPSVGGSPLARAGEIAFQEMQDRGFTDMRDKTDIGETAVPKIPSNQQKALDGFWGGSRAAGGFNMPMLLQHAKAGGPSPVLDIYKAWGKRGKFVPK